MIKLRKPEGCCIPDCFNCPLPDCEYSEEDRLKDHHAEVVRNRRRANPEKYREMARRQRERMKQKDPGHYARLQKAYRAKTRPEGDNRKEPIICSQTETSPS